MISEDATTLLAVEAALEEFPDGTYGGPRRTTPDPQADEHVRDLLEGLDGWRLGDRAKRPEWRPA
ncbi:hypothetical protein OG244_19550 [Streptomyces brevispora]|uniref:hypothetical protein n=1 Tax=Streptomyces brevispora TaxID=887462 RepID=UPI002E2F37A1|nr:hypothetical protein [Streptomyces brevispora]